MSISLLLGVIFAIVIAVVLIRLVMEAFSRYGWPIDPFLSRVIWAIALIFCIFLLAYGLGIPIPFFHW